MVIFDDILVGGGGDSPEQAMTDHTENIFKLLDRCRERNIKLNAEKMKLCHKEVSFMGHVLTSRGLKPDPEKVRAVMNMKPPENKPGIQRIVGFVSYLSRFMPHLSSFLQPIRELLRQDVLFRWTAAQDQAFRAIQQQVSHTPVTRVVMVWAQLSSSEGNRSVTRAKH